MTRVLIGYSRGKDIAFIVILNIIFLIVAYISLMYISEEMTSRIIPNHFKEKVIPFNKSNYSTWEWNYFVIGTALLSVSFMPIAQNYSSSYNSGCSSGCGSSCGSSCGGGCGGCGGCGG
ncbi:MAG: hypothetical protein HC854_06540 [Flavobacterium sp.]|nr:hypothetical protein [Flavobacterium sp.]